MHALGVGLHSSRRHHLVTGHLQQRVFPFEAITIEPFSWIVKIGCCRQYISRGTGNGSHKRLLPPAIEVVWGGIAEAAALFFLLIRLCIHHSVDFLRVLDSFPERGVQM